MLGYQMLTYSCASSSTSSSTVPVGYWVTEALANGYTLVSERGKSSKHVLGQVVGGLFVNVVTNLEPLAVRSSSATLGDVALEPVLGALNKSGRVVLVVIGVDIEVSDVVTKVSHVSLALSSAAGVWWAHVGRDLANDVTKSHLVLPHLVLAIDLGDGTQVQMGPGVRSNLMALGVHTLDNIHKLCGGIDLALVDVVASDEESSLGVVGSHQIQDVGGEDLLRTVIVGNGYGSWRNAVVDTVTAILNGAKFGASDSRGVGATGSDVLWARWAMGVVTTRGVAVVVSSTAV